MNRMIRGRACCTSAAARLGIVMAAAGTYMAASTNWGVLFVGVLMITAILFGVYTRLSDFGDSGIKRSGRKACAHNDLL